MIHQIITLPGTLTRLEARLTDGGDKTPVICIHGLTRNAADFDELAPLLAATGRNVIALSLRGRGRSDYDPNLARYFPTTYRDDVLAVLDHFGIQKAIFVGTSLGGITTILANESHPTRVAAAIINDVGPELAPEGLERIAGYVGKFKGPAASIEEAAARIKDINAVAFPDVDEQFWRKMAERTFRKASDGWVLDYDPNIAPALAANGPAPDLWPSWASLAQTPTLLVHGELSDLLTAPIIAKMRKAHPNFDYICVPRIGHAPMMTEPAAWAALQAFLQKLP